MCRSRMRHSGNLLGNARRNSAADVKAEVRKACDFSNRDNAFNTDGSSSTIAIQDIAFDIQLFSVFSTVIVSTSSSIALKANIASELIALGSQARPFSAPPS